MTYVIESVLSAAIMGLFVFVSYLLFNYAFSTPNILITIGIYVVWFILAFLAAFASGSILHDFAYKVKDNGSISMPIGIAWAIIIVAVSIYPWFKQPYSTELIILRAIGNIFSVSFAVMMFLMVALMGTRQ